jgi:hypothetical protein
MYYSDRVELRTMELFQTGEPNGLRKNSTASEKSETRNQKPKVTPLVNTLQSLSSLGLSTRTPINTTYLSYGIPLKLAVCCCMEVFKERPWQNIDVRIGGNGTQCRAVVRYFISTEYLHIMADRGLKTGTRLCPIRAFLEWFTCRGRERLARTGG